MAIIAVRDPHFATEPDYYQKAIRWDQTQAQAATNQRLGYAIKVPASLSLDPQGRTLLELSLSDGLGRRVHGAQLVGQAFANAYSGELVSLVFNEQSAGVYVAKLDVRHTGLWIFRIAGQSGADHFTADARVDLTRGRGA
jgi:hypothetical protein